MSILTLMMKKTLSLLMILCLTGCASVVNHTTQQIPVDTDPSGANVFVDCGDVKNDPKLVTPAVVTVQRKADHCSISFEKPGYRPAEVTLAKSMSGWYLGNIVLGGFIGLIVDASNGAMYKRTPSEVKVSLAR
jgi:CxxC motif-containing protein